MESITNEFSKDQIRFMAAMEACGEPAPVELLQTMAPLSPDQFNGLYKICRKSNWIAETDDNKLGLTRDLPESIRYELNRINTPDRVARHLNKLQTRNLASVISKTMHIRLLANSGKTEEAADIELDLAHEFLKQRDHDQAYQYVSRAVGRLHSFIVDGGDGRDRVFVDAVLELSSLSFAVGRGMQVLSSYLRTAVNLAESQGNLRSHALACLHLGRLLAYLDRFPEGIAMLGVGKEEVEQLGDADILKAAAEFLGLYYAIQGRLKEALVHYERAEHQLTQEDDWLLVYPMILWNMGTTLFAVGQVPRALGLFQRYWRSARDMGLPAVASICRSILGFSLAIAHKREQALFHLNASLKEARESRYAYSLTIARAGLAIVSFHDGDLKKSYELLGMAIVEGQKVKSTLVFMNLYLQDMLASFHYHGFDPISEGWAFKEQLEKCLNEKNLPQRGVALRIRAEDNMRSGASASLVMEDLAASKAFLEKAGDAFALNDTFISMARLKLREGAIDEARGLVRETGILLRVMGLEPDYLPRELRALLDDDAETEAARDSTHMLVDRFLAFLHELDNSQDVEELFHHAVSRMSQLLGAERGALFWAPTKGDPDKLELRAGYNLTRREIESESFKPSLEFIRKAFRENRYIRTRPELPDYISLDENIKGLLCLPIQAGSDVRGVLYYDNSYVRVNFDFIPPKWTPLLVNHTNRYISHILEKIQLREETSRLAANKSIQLEHLGSDPILAQAPAMLRMLDQAEKAAGSEATLLVTGETGTGKELLVSRMHRLSRRSGGPFIVVDSTTIPENLVESELFGHEKGAFTGADVRKRGRIELAHQGTLFIDEIGELPLQVQAKLLRALETKTFYRVGGTQPVKSDFRLVAATNRRLADEVAKGRFRQDLYYRLNVIPIMLPPLRERGDDIILLARHFFRKYCSKYDRKELELSRLNEDKLAAYPWPGNVRELKNVIERAVILSTGAGLVLDLPRETASPEEQAFLETPTMDDLQRSYIKYVIEKTGGKIYGPGGAAEILGMKRSTLYTRMYKLGLRNIEG